MRVGGANDFVPFMKAIAVAEVLAPLGRPRLTIHVAGAEAHPSKLDAWVSTLPESEGVYCLGMGATVDPQKVHEGLLRGGQAMPEQERPNAWAAMYDVNKDAMTLEEVIYHAFRHHKRTTPTTDSRFCEDSKSHLNLSLY